MQQKLPKEICESIMKFMFLFGSARESVARVASSVVGGMGIGAGLCVTADSMGRGGRSRGVVAGDKLASTIFEGLVFGCGWI